MNPGTIALLASLLMSLLAGASQVSGFFSKANVPTALLTVPLAVVVATVFPALLRQSMGRGELIIGLSPGAACVVASFLVLALGTGPFVVKWALADHNRWIGLDRFERGEDSGAKVPLERAQALLETLGLNKSAADARIPLAQIAARRGDTKHARELLASVERSSLGSKDLQARHDLAAGVVAYRLGHLLEAETRFQQARQNVEKGSLQEAALLQNAASVAVDLDRRNVARAKEDYLAAAALYEEQGSRSGQAQILNNLAALPDVPWEEAHQLLQQALSLAVSAGHAGVLGDVQLNLGRGFRIAGDFEKAVSLYADATKNYEQAADSLGIAAVQLNVAVLEATRSRAALAKTDLAKARARYANLSDDDAIPAGRLAPLEATLADQFDALGERQEAEEAYRQALHLCAVAGRAELEADVRINYAGHLEAQGRSDDARQQLAQARELLDAFGGLERLGVYSINRGRLAQDTGDYARARVHYEHARTYFEELGDRLAVAQALENLAALKAFEGRPDRNALLRVLDTYRKAGANDRVAQTLHNLYATYTEPTDEAQRYVDELLEFLPAHRIDPTIEVNILTQLLPQVMPEAQRVPLRERLRAMLAGAQLTPDLRCKALLQLARLEQLIGNHDAALEHAEQADELASRVPLPARVQVLSDLGMMFLVHGRVDRGLRRLFDAFDVTTNNVEFARHLMKTIAVVSADAQLRETDSHRRKLDAIRARARDEVVRQFAEEALTRLRPGPQSPTVH